MKQHLAFVSIHLNHHLLSFFVFLSLFLSDQSPKTSAMPGLINKENWSALPLSDSDITSCVRGYTLALTASMTYENIEDHAIEGKCVCSRQTTDLFSSLTVGERYPFSINLNPPHALL